MRLRKWVIIMEKVFESENLYYVKVNRELINDYLNMINDREIRKLISDKSFVEITYDQELEWVNEKLNNNSVVFSIIEKETNEFVGNIELMNIRSNIGELGISISSNKQNKHYGTESIKAMINYIYENKIVEELDLNVFNFNERAIHCYEKIGFVKDGIGITENDIHMKYKK